MPRMDQLREALTQRVAALDEELRLVEAERDEFARDRAELDRRRVRNRRELAGYLLPDVDDDALAGLERRLRYAGLLAIKRQHEALLAASEAERVQLEADPRYLERDVRRVDLDTQEEEIRDSVASFRADREPWEASLHFQELASRGWFAPDYHGGLFDRLRDWRAASLLMAELERGGVAAFDDDDALKARWQALDADSSPVIALAERLAAERADLDALLARHAELVAAPPELFQRMWDALAEAVLDHLSSCPEATRVDLARGDETLATFLKKDAGLAQQMTYLDDVARARVEPVRARLAADIRKISGKIQRLRDKAARGKFVRVTEDDLQSARRIPRAKWQKRRAGFAKTRTRIRDFEDYRRGSFTEDYLWWDLVTRGARADDIAAVTVFHQHHPGWSLAGWADPLAVADPTDRAQAAADIAAFAEADRLSGPDDLLDVS